MTESIVMISQLSSRPCQHRIGGRDITITRQDASQIEAAVRT